jgi:transposase
MKKKASRRRVEVNVEELDRIIDGAMREPLNEADGQTLKTALHTMAERLVRARNTEKTSAVLGDQNSSATSEEPQTETGENKPAGHGRNGANGFRGAEKVKIAHPNLQSGHRCPDCGRGNVYEQKEPKVLVRIVGQAPLAATVYELERLRCNACGQIFTAQEPEGIGPEKYDETAAAMIAQMKYGSGVPFHRLEQMEGLMGIPLPASTQWEIVEEAAEPMKPAHEELIRQAAQGGVLYNDDTSMKVLRLAREPSDQRTGVFTSSILAITTANHKIALYFTGRQHAGENMADVLKQRAQELPAPIQMCDALSRNIPKASGVQILLANCMAHGRRQFVEIAPSFPAECRYVLESLGVVYYNDAMAREQSLSAEDRLRLHQDQSGPVMEQLHAWLEAQFAEKKTEPNSGLGKAITYLLRHWKGLTAFLRHEGAPLDNNICEQALKRAVLHRKNALFYKTLNGAQVGDLFMTLIHTCHLCGANSFDYLTELQRHAGELNAGPAEWMPWNYRETLGRSTRSVAPVI